MYIPVASSLWPEGLAGQLSIQEPLQGAVGVEGGTVMRPKLRHHLNLKAN